LFDNQTVQSIGAIAVAPSNPNIIYVGTGEADPRSQVSYGDGMYKSADAGNPRIIAMSAAGSWAGRHGRSFDPTNFCFCSSSRNRGAISGIQHLCFDFRSKAMDSRFRGNDEVGVDGVR
jgi:hypothetical protein